MKVEEHDVDAAVLERLLGFTDCPSLENGVALKLQVDSTEQPQRRIVVDNKHCRGVDPHLPSVAADWGIRRFPEIATSARTQSGPSLVYALEMRNRPEPEQVHTARKRLEAELPQPTPSFRRRAWLQFQRAIDPLGPPRPLRRVQP
jgi:hypothetical protein